MIKAEELTIKKTGELLRARAFSARELAEAFLKKIELENKKINAYIEVFDDCIKDADRADRAIAEGGGDALTGIPLAIKDAILIKDRRCSAASRMLEQYRATYDAHVISRLRGAHAVFIGRTNMDEFAMGASTENSAFGPVKNPHDISRVPGGSSGGSAAAVAANLALGALGSDTGGSIRQPASFCGVVGLKPTYGAVSRRGLIAMASSLDQIGPIAKNVDDVEIFFNAIRSKDPEDSTSLEYRPNSVPAGRRTIIGVPRDFLKGVDADVLAHFEQTLKKLSENGYEIKDIAIPHIASSLSVYYILMPAEASANLARFDGIRYGLSVQGGDIFSTYKNTRARGFGREVQRRILLGTYVLSAGYYDAYYNKANAVRGLIKSEFEKAFEEADIIATPTAPTPAFKIGEIKDPVSMYLADIFTVPVNLVGIPAISVPSGTVSREDSSLPLGFQAMAPHFGEERLFEVGRSVEKIR